MAAAMLLVFVLAMMAGAGPTPCVCLTPAEDAFQFGDFDFELDRSLPSKLSGWSMAIADFHSNPGSYPKKESERTECKLLDYVLNIPEYPIPEPTKGMLEYTRALFIKG